MERVQTKFSILHLLLIAAVLVTTVIHLYLGLAFGDVLFLLNALGFVGLTALYLLPIKMLQPYRGLVRWVLMGYSLLTIIMWAIMNGKLDAPGIAAKSVEVLIIILLFLDRKSS